MHIQIRSYLLLVRSFPLLQINNMFSDELIDQLSQFIIRPHREMYGLDKLGPKKIIIKSASVNNYIEVFRQQCTILSEGKKVQMSLFQPYHKPYSNGLISSGSQFAYNEYLTKSVKLVDESNNSLNFNAGTDNQVTIFLHTNSGSRLEGLQYIKYLLQHGHMACLFDYTGSGVSEGEYVSMGLNEAKDLANVVKHLQDKFAVDRVNLWGRSMGAVTAVLYCAKYSRNVKKMVLDSPFCSFRQLVKQIVNARTGLPQFLFGTIFSKIEQNIKKKLHVNLMDIDLKQEIVKPGMQKIPIFFLISKDDKLVQPIHVQTLYEAHKGPKKIIYLEGSHNKTRPTQIREQCAQFLCSKINNVSSQKTIQHSKKHFLTLLSRKLSQDGNHDKRTKLVSSSLILNHNDLVDNQPQHNPHHQSVQMTQYSSSSSNINNYGMNNFNKEKLHLNLKKHKLDTQQSSAQSTPRDDNSVSKYSTASKISLSQLKKSQTEMMMSSGSTELQSPTLSMSNNNHHNNNNVSINQSKSMQPYPPNFNTTLDINYINNNYVNVSHQYVNSPLDGTNKQNHQNYHTQIIHGNGLVDFKKHSRTMAIQYKNKIKQHINRI